MKEERYCHKCGSKMLILGENFDISYWEKFRHMYYDYDSSGKKYDLTGTKYKCPKEKFWNNHSMYFIENNRRDVLGAFNPPRYD